MVAVLESLDGAAKLLCVGVVVWMAVTHGARWLKQVASDSPVQVRVEISSPGEH
jgi:hypothetical protein